MSDKPHMVKQTITFSDGTETVINYRGVVVDGVVTPDVVEENEIILETPTVSEEVAELGAVEETAETPEAAEEAPAESVEETA